ncbi:MAG: hypothetical protein AAFN93_13835 [Bacteroidota bacterium]
MKNTLIVLLSIALAACSGTKEDNEVTQLRKEVIAIHDEAMEQMGTMANLKSKLNDNPDSIKSEQYSKAAQSLDEAHNHMMAWMRNFAKEFPAPSLHGDSHDHGDKSHSKTTEMNIRSAEELQKLLMAEKDKVVALQQEINDAIEEAKNTLTNDSIE